MARKRNSNDNGNGELPGGEPEAPRVPLTPAGERRMRVKRAVKFLYDIQNLRIACSLRATDGPGDIVIDEPEKEFLGKTSDGLHGLEKAAVKEVKRQLAGIPIWERWLKHQKGVGPGMGGVIVGSFDIERQSTPSKMWAFAGLAVVDGRAPHPVRGQKLNYNAWLRAKLVKVLAECFIKTGSPWRKVYDDRKLYRRSQLLDVCMACEGTGKSRYTKVPGATRETHPCDNCKGRGGACMWGKSDAHRDRDAKRYMIKMFLLELWTHWRKLEGLPTRTPYHEEKLGRVHSGAAIGGDLREEKRRRGSAVTMATPVVERTRPDEDDPTPEDELAVEAELDEDADAA